MQERRLANCVPLKGGRMKKYWNRYIYFVLIGIFILLSAINGQENYTSLDTKQQDKIKLPILDRQNIVEALLAMDQRICLLERENQKLKEDIQQVNREKQVLEKGLEQLKQEKQAVMDLVEKQSGLLNDLKNSHPSPLNLFANSTFTDLDSAQVPVGWFCYGAGITMLSVHCYTKGFIGPYTNEKPANTVTNTDFATESSPYWYGVYNCGPRISRWGWGALNFRLLHLKISGNSDCAGVFQHCSSPLFIGNERGRYHIRCYVKVIQGRLGLSQDVGCSSLIVNKEMCDQSPQGWYLVDGNICHSNTNSVYIGFGRPGSIKEDLECYIALPYVYAENALWVDQK